MMMMRCCALLLLISGLLSAADAADLPLAEGSDPAEIPPSDGPWRPHLLARCQKHFPPRGRVLEYVDEAQHLFRSHNGGDASELLEIAIAEQGGHPWLLLLLAQIYLLAGQGEPHCLPSSGPLAPGGDWSRDRERLLERGEDLLNQLARIWSDDSVVDFLAADLARIRDDHAGAAELDHLGRRNCSHMESLELLASLRGLHRRPAELLTLPDPAYPAAAIARRAQGEVVFDILIDPFGRVHTVHQVGRADADLARSAMQAIRDGGYQAACIGYYPVWSWLRVPVRFRIAH